MNLIILSATHLFRLWNTLQYNTWIKAYRFTSESNIDKIDTSWSLHIISYRIIFISHHISNHIIMSFLLCFVLVCSGLLCYVMLCYVMLCYVLLCYVMLYYVMLCYVMLCHHVLIIILHRRWKQVFCTRSRLMCDELSLYLTNVWNVNGSIRNRYFSWIINPDH